MPEYPEDVITHDRKGNPEVRWLVEKGKFVKYQYVNPKTGKVVEGGKFSIILRNSAGKDEHFYLIPIKGRYLAIPLKEGKNARKVWNPKAKKAEKPF